MLEKLHMHHVGPAEDMAVEFEPRLNVLTGDNGLGKSFILDVAWWCLTRTWARGPVMPHPQPSEPKLEWTFSGRSKKINKFESAFNRLSETWSVKQGRPAIPGMVLYAQVDGGFSVWDPARNYWKTDSPERPAAYHFTPEEVWNGNAHCEGLVRDWASWQREDNQSFAQLKGVLRGLSASPTEALQPGELRKISVGDPKRYPTLRMSYGQDVPVVFASAGMRRVIALAYILVWAWEQHREAANFTGQKTANEIIFLVDEIEAHLHPQWQRLVVPSVLKVMEELTGAEDVKVQLITATHSPLVLASTEEFFDEEQDAVWELDLRNGHVELSKYPWAKRGDANNWLTSPVFDLKTAKPRKAEEAYLRALALARSFKPQGVRLNLQGVRQEILATDQLLRETLPNLDPFWIRWNAFREQIMREE